MVHGQHPIEQDNSKITIAAVSNSDKQLISC